MHIRKFKFLLTAVLASSAIWPIAHAQMAQDPLLSHTASVESNITFMFDDSASMPATYLYQYGGSPGVFGMSGPTPTTYAAKSPDVNLLYYDPRKTYSPRINANGTYQASGPISGISSFNVYFYNPSSTNTYSVSTVGINTNGGGYPTSGVTGSFNTAPAGGTTATVGSITMASSLKAQSVAITSLGSGYPSNGAGVIATFSAPAAGGIRAVGAPIMGISTSVSSVAVASGGTYPIGSTITASFTPAPSGTGVPATITSVQTTSTYGVATGTASVNVTSAGSYTAAPTVSFPTPPTGGVRALASLTFKVISVAVTCGSSCSGYGAVGTRTVNFSSPPAGGTTAVGTATINGAGQVTAIAINNAGSGYTSAPTVLSLTGGGSGATYNVSFGVDKVNVTTTGSGYTSLPAVSFSTGAAAATVVTPGTMTITGITLGNHGSGYLGTPGVLLSNNGTGSTPAFTVTPVTTGVITGVTISNVGYGYTSTPTVAFSAPTGSGGTTATGTVTTGSTYGIATVNVSNPGSGYLTTPVLTLANTGSGSGATWTVNTTATPVAGVNQRWNGIGSPTALSNFFNPSYLPDAASPLATGATATLTYPNTASSTTTNYPRFRNRSDCGATSCTWTQEQQNYANWLTYHSNRLDLAKTGIGLAFQGLNPTFRLGWGTINTIANSSLLDMGVRLYDTATQTAFFNWLYARTGNVGATPNRIALDKVGTYYQRVDDSGPWATTPPIGATSVTSGGSEVSSHASCRRSYSLLMTDGYYNDSFTLADTDTSTATAISSPSFYQYTPIGPYSDTANNTKIANTFADVAMKYWMTDLRPTIGNNVRPTSGDPAYWQHMNFYAIGLGLTGTLDATNPSVLASLTGTSATRTLNWPTPVGNDPLAIDDMWHATINGHGKMFNVSDAKSLGDAIGQMLTDVASTSSDQAGVAVSTGIQLTNTTEKFTPLYDRQYWTGDVKASNISTGAVSWEVETKCTNASLCPVPEKPYIDLIPSATCTGPYGANCRNIYVGTGASSGTRAVKFTYSDMDSTLLGQMTGTTSSNLINYLRGDASNENIAANSLVASAIYRVRPNKLGDIVNSTPAFVGAGTLDMGYGALPSGTSGQSSYATYLSQKNLRPEGLLAVGANDGMLHFFRDGVTSSQPGGIETFAYIPNAMLPTLNQLADTNYGTTSLPHRYFVDGPNVEADAYINGTWTNMVLGSTGGGAGVASSNGVSPRTAVYAIDTTSVNSGITNSSGVPLMDATKVLWEISSKNPNGTVNTNFRELGYVLNDIQAGTTKDGSWVAIFGNGYESAACHAQLFVVNLANGALISKIDTGVGGGDCTSTANTNRNGLGGVRVVRNANQQIIGAYAGDLQGNMWKFNLNDSNPSNWGVDLGGAPLFKAGSTQPITAPPSVVSLPIVWAPVATPDHGYMVVIGTGKFFELSDISTTSNQSVYGIWDPVEFGVSSAAYAGVPLTNTNLLVQQTIGSAQTGNGVSTTGNTYFGVSSNIVCYTGSCSGTPAPPTNRRGWWINLPATGERMVYPMEILARRYVSIGTLSPSSVSTLDPCNLTSAGTAYTTIVDALSGAGPSYPVFDTNGDGAISSSDLPVSRYQQQTADGRHVTVQDCTNGCSGNGSGSGGSSTCVNGVSTSTQKFNNIGGMTTGKNQEQFTVNDICNSPKASTIKTREWRQLLMR